MGIYEHTSRFSVGVPVPREAYDFGDDDTDAEIEQPAEVFPGIVLPDTATKAWPSTLPDKTPVATCQTSTNPMGLTESEPFQGEETRIDLGEVGSIDDE